ncbi:MAG: hypothetical protein A2039_05860 [Candidatus Melainabacteria bacterium GWA2_34_9]|nr:MAG: hypothetical protein A2039_05860 [Candidatus Melainabacteria bacterium GWA2_34_9]
MKYTKIIIISLFCFFLFNAIQLPATSKVLTGEVSFDWTFKNQEERDKTINYYYNLLFENVQKTIDTKEFAENKKDKDRNLNEYFIKNNILSLQDRKLTGFYIFKKILYCYAIKYENKKKNIYYYDAMGTLRYFDILEKPYNEYPYKASQYDASGKLKGVTYYIAEDDQYAFKADGKFYCRWYQDKCYDKKAKVIITRKIQE